MILIQNDAEKAQVLTAKCQDLFTKIERTQDAIVEMKSFGGLNFHETMGEYDDAKDSLSNWKHDFEAYKLGLKHQFGIEFEPNWE